MVKAGQSRRVGLSLGGTRTSFFLFILLGWYFVGDGRRLVWHESAFVFLAWFVSAVTMGSGNLIVNGRCVR